MSKKKKDVKKFFVPSVGKLLTTDEIKKVTEKIKKKLTSKKSK